MPVVDASVLVEYLAGGDHADQAREKLLASRAGMWAPHLVDAEVGHVLGRAVLVQQIRPSVAREALADLAQLPLRRAGHTGLLERAWALRANLSFYDALYVALAERVKLPLLTLDARLVAAPGLRAEIELLT
jgi:predicted nucleic acid-binding protein